MSIPYIPLYVADYEADTAHLTLEEDGAYMRLLRLCWRTPGCAIPDDPAWIMRRMRCSADEFHRVVRPILDEFFSTEKARLFSPRLRAELERIEDTSRKRSAAGKMGGRPAKALKKRATDKSPAKANGKHLEPEPELDKKDTKVSQKNGTRLPPDWTLPDEWGQWAVNEGWPAASVRIEGEQFRDYWISKTGRDATKRDWLATWRGWIRNDYAKRGPKHGKSDRSAAERRAETALDAELEFVAGRWGGEAASQADGEEFGDSREPRGAGSGSIVPLLAAVRR